MPKLANKAPSSILDKFERKISGQGAVRAGKVITLFISNEEMDNIIKIVQSLEKSSLLIDGASETVKHEIKKQECGFLPCYDGTYGWFIDCSYGFFIDITCSFFIDKCYKWKNNKKVDFFHY